MKTNPDGSPAVYIETPIPQGDIRTIDVAL
jgi:hypothetical protein